MKTLILTKIDNKKIVIGFDEPSIDPVATAASVIKELIKTDEAKNLEVAKNELNSQLLNLRNNNKIIDSCKFILSNNKSSKVDRDNATEQIRDISKLINSIKENIDKVRDNFKKAISDLNEKSKTLHYDNAKYFNPGMNSKIISDSEYITLKDKIESLDKNQVLESSGDIISDNRGESLWKKTNNKWENKTIDAIGVEITAGWKSDLTESEQLEINSQIEIDDYNKLSASNKVIFKDSQLESILTQSALMKIKLEIQEDSDALAKSQAWYQEQVNIINEKFA